MSKPGPLVGVVDGWIVSVHRVADARWAYTIGRDVPGCQSAIAASERDFKTRAAACKAADKRLGELRSQP